MFLLVRGTEQPKNSFTQHEKREETAVKIKLIIDVKLLFLFCQETEAQVNVGQK